MSELRSPSLVSLQEYIHSTHLEADNEGVEVEQVCEECNTNSRQSKIYKCVPCETPLCSDCWFKYSPHKKGKNPNHEKSVPLDATIVHEILRVGVPLASSRQPEAVTIRGNDADNMWFGVTQDDAKDYILGEGAAYNELVLVDSNTSPFNTYPGLVSFVGNTGAGKSTLINLLIRFSQSNKRRSQATPIVGERGGFLSTSANVHLYSDPDTIDTNSPTLYADCEGMRGTDNPVADREGPIDNEHPSTSRPLQRPSWFKPIKVEWEQDYGRDSRSGRQSIAANLYPRILYIFSDVIVYVLESRRGFQDAFYDLVSWAHNAMEQSCNKPILPHAILTFNNNHNPIESELYDSDYAVDMLMSAFKNIRNMPQFKEYISYWDQKDRHPTREKPTIDSGEALLKCYYADIKVVHFPNENKPTRIRTQTDILRMAVRQACERSQEGRAKVGMKLNAATLPLYVRTALNQFASSLDKPFDFGEAWFELNPISFEFGDAILNLAKLVKDNYEVNGIELWNEIGGFIASCFHLNSCRADIKRADLGRLLSKHWDECEKAARCFWHKFWPCQEEGGDGYGSCVNGPDGHRHHQFYPKTGTQKGYVTIGGHRASHSEQALLEDLKARISNKLSEIATMTDPRDKMEQSRYIDKVSKLHQANVNELFKKMKDVGKCVSHSTCLWCLDKTPEHSLPCGHVICSPCLRAVAEPVGEGGFFRLEACPLLANHNDIWATPWIGALKPAQAGIRVMTLDGGGIRGIVELEILMRIQKYLGEIPLREFFDLIIGTSAGGIIALGLGPGEMDVHECNEKFEMFSKEAFSTHGSTKLPIIGPLLKYVYWGWSHGKYQSGPLEEAFRSVFPTDRMLFGGVNQYKIAPTKVAVTTTTQRGQVVVLSNYNRKSPAIPLYHFHRPGPDKELRLWQAARATSAAPLYFSPFSHTLSEQVYMDGGLYHNNPITVAHSESKAIWPDYPAAHPDLLLSIGTGSDKKGPKAPHFVDLSSVTGDMESPQDERRPPYFKELMNVGVDHILNGLNCDQKWHEWLQVRSPEAYNARRYRRLTVTFDNPVEMDDTANIQICRDIVNSHISDSEVRVIADQLIASCFYYRFNQGSIKRIRDGGRGNLHERDRFECVGTFECRLFPGEGSSLSMLGTLLKKFQKENFSPQFLVRETHRKYEYPKKAVILDQILDKMIEKGEFSMPHTITISSELAETEILMILRKDEQQLDKLFPISGFPRKLQHDHEVIIEEKTSLRFNLLIHILSLPRALGSNRRLKEYRKNKANLHESV